MFSRSENIRLSALKVAGSALMRSGNAARLSILIYHRVLPGPDPLLASEPDASEFERQMALLSDYFNVLPLTEAVDRLQRGRLPKRAACITFDDGYADNAATALPILLRWNIPATFFISTAFLDGGCMWNDAVIESVRGMTDPILDLTAIGLGTCQVDNQYSRQNAISRLLGRLKYLSPVERLSLVSKIVSVTSTDLPDNLMMTSTQIRDLSNAGMEIGGHTVNHPILTSIEDAAARDEIAHGKEELAHITGSPVRFFAYPNGIPGKDYASSHVRIVRSLGFVAALSTGWGAAKRGMDMFQLPRFTPWDKTPERFMIRLILNNLFNKTPTV